MTSMMGLEMTMMASMMGLSAMISMMGLSAMISMMGLEMTKIVSMMG